ncbi:hypothetical protein [Saccharopolyspora sp. 5N708]|uniref:hypothetical protein n=1 Tax=Saccharopolyspora sp. 5N708 TaxID=3457424 RepID=UPI003FD612E6
MGTTAARRAGWRALVLWPVLVCAAFSLAGCADSARRDATTVYCLATAQQRALVDAAVALGLAQRGPAAAAPQPTEPDTAPPQATEPDPKLLRVTEPDRRQRDLTVPQWRTERPRDFDRACKAISTIAIPPNPNGLQAVWNVLLPVLAGAVLTLLTTTWRDETSRGRLLADDLRSAAAAFTKAVEEYLSGWTDPSAPGRPADKDVRDRRAELDARLRTVCVLHSRWRAPRRLRRQLTGNRFGDEIVQGWTTNRDEQTQRAATLRTELSQLDTAINQVAHALERPWRPHRNMLPAEPRKTDR